MVRALLGFHGQSDPLVEVLGGRDGLLLLDGEDDDARLDAVLALGRGLGLVLDLDAELHHRALLAPHRADFEDMMRPRDTGKKGQDADHSQVFKGGLTGRSKLTGETYFTDEQLEMLNTKGRSPTDLWAYAESIKPTYEEYLDFRFGTDEQKAAFSDSMTARIEASNKQYEWLTRMNTVVNQGKKNFYGNQTGV